MADSIVQTSKNVTLIGAGDVNKGQLDAALEFAPYVIAADGGAQMALNYGIPPEKVIGDFDSVDKKALAKIPKNNQIHVSEQDSTDFDKCLRLVLAPLFLGVGFLGGRVDHQLAAFSSLIKHTGSRCILIGAEDLVFHVPRQIDLTLRPGSRLSLFPMMAVSGVSTGLHWPIEGLQFSPGVQIGTSNRVTDGPVSLQFAGRGMLVIVPRDALGAVVAASCA
ncbi:MAG: thiamine diphosphokinase [Paracoccaceae bacterium]